MNNPAEFTVVFQASQVLRDYEILKSAAAGEILAGHEIEDIIDFAKFIWNIVIVDDPVMSDEMRGFARSIVGRAAPAPRSR